MPDKVKFYEFKNQNEESSDLFIYGDIISDEEQRWYESDVTVKGFKEGLDSLKDGSTLNIYINSGGGSVFAAVSMVNMLQRAKEQKNLSVYAYIDGLAASAASLFPFAADETHVYTNSMLMIHKPSVFLFGSMNADDFRHQADVLDKIEDSVLLSTYMGKVRNGTTETQMKHLIAKETWMSADDIVEMFDGFVKDETEKNVQNCRSTFFNSYKHTPERFRAEADPEDKPVEEPVNDESNAENGEQGSDVQPVDGENKASDDAVLAKIQIMKMIKETQE